ncbi:PD-(D/E)XK motif protein [Pseudomonas sichuanensis]|uniref:PD-(D/E)XK motif protein n=1 Tax=Pseudomonas sichuanensis TaxID=2213015 RepID=UPI00380B7F68
MLTSLFFDLSAAKQLNEFCACAISERRQDFLAKGAQGEPVFLLHDSSEAKYTPGIRYRHVNASFHNLCRIDVSGKIIENSFAVIACDPDTPELYELFISCFGAAIQSLPPLTETKQINAIILNLLSLFRELAKPSSIEITGFWAELFLIRQSSRKIELLRHWHSDPYERFDFSFSDSFLEVKSTIKTTRIHEFSYNQLRLPEGRAGVIASILMLPNDGGVGILELAKDIDNSLPEQHDLRNKLWSNVAKALGADFSKILDRRFDLNYSRDNLQLYYMGDIPTIDQALDPRISNIRYSANLEGVQSSATEATWASYGMT